MSNKSLDVDHEIKQLRKIQPHWNQLDNEKENKVRISIYIYIAHDAVRQRMEWHFCRTEYILVQKSIQIHICIHDNTQQNS